MPVVDVQIGSTLVRGCVVMTSKYPGFCQRSRTRFPVGTQIAFKSAANLTEDEKRGLFGTGKVYPFTVIHQENAPAARPAFDPSEYQKDILNSTLTQLLGKRCHMEIKAYAGSGKTTTLVWLVHELTKLGRLPANVLYLAFNKSIQEELSARLAGTRCPALTTHAFGFMALRNRFGASLSISNRTGQMFSRLLCEDRGLEVNSKSMKIIRDLPEFTLKAPTAELVGYIKNWCIRPEWDGATWNFDAQHEAIKDLIQQYEIECEGRPDKVLDYAVRIVQRSIPTPNAPLSEIDYDDMLYLPLILNLPFPRYDLVLTDESQDFNNCQISMLQKMVQDGANIAFVGDPNQALYHFRGADADAFDNIGKSLKQSGDLIGKVLPQSYRSCQRIVQHARRWVPDFEGFRPERGTVESIAFGQMLSRLNNNRHDIALPDGVDGRMRELNDCSFGVLCRTNLPLFVAAYACLGQGLKVQLIGRAQIGEPLKRIIWQICGEKDTDENYTNSIADVLGKNGAVKEEGLLSRLAYYFQQQSRKFNSEGFEKKLEKLQQDVECIQVVASRVSDDKVSSVIAEIDSLVSDEPDPSAIQFSTVHRAKGLEWNVVFILRPDLLPHPSATTPQDIHTERCCCYVAWTRAKDRIYAVSDWPFDGKSRDLAFDSPEEFMPSLEEEPVDSTVLAATQFQLPVKAEKVEKPPVEKPEPTGFVDDGEPF